MSKYLSFWNVYYGIGQFFTRSTNKKKNNKNISFSLNIRANFEKSHAKKAKYKPKNTHFDKNGP